MRSHLLEGKVRHRRVRPFDYELEHGVCYLALDLDELDEVARAASARSRNRRNARGVPRRRPPATRPRTTSRRRSASTCAASGHDPTGWRITLVTNPRVLGYVFNPASFYLCRDAAGELRVVVVEVHNTHGERHLYTLAPPHRTMAASSRRRWTRRSTSRRSSTSTGGYTVRVRDEPDEPAHRDRRATQDGGLLLHTSLVLRRRPLTDRTLAADAPALPARDRTRRSG